MVNDLLQWQVKAFFNDTARLVLNTTIGIGGLFDPATRAGLDKNDRDFGQTLGEWGVKSGPYVVLPVLGPSDVRDAVGRRGGRLTPTRAHYIRTAGGLEACGACAASTTAPPALPRHAVQNAYDPYAFIRNAYLQHRDFKVSGGQSDPDESQQEQKLMDEADKAEKDNAAAAAATPTPPAPSPPGSPPPQ